MATQSAVLDNSAALKVITQRALVLTPACGTALALLHKGAMTCCASAGASTPPLGCSLDVSSGFSGECVRTGKTLRCDDAEVDPRVDVASCRRLGIRSIIAVPILAGQEVVGLLEVFSSWPFAFSDAHVEIVQRLASAALQSQPPAKTTPPKLLVELEARHRVFLRNTIDLLLLRRPAPLKLTSTPGRFWPDVFVPSRMPWEAFFQSMALHVMMMAVLGSALQLSLVERHPLTPRPFDKSEVIYYLPAEYAPLLARVNEPTALPRRNGQPTLPTNSQSAALKTPALRVAREPRRNPEDSISPPELRLKQDPHLLRIVAFKTVIPAMPLSVTGGSRLITPAALVTAVAPAPELSAVSGRRGLNGPGQSVIAPPPSVQRSLSTMGDLSIGHLQVIAPAPRLAMVEQNSILGKAAAALGGAINRIVAPAPSVSNIASSGRQGMGWQSGTAMPVVPPPPSVLASGGRQRMASLSGTATQVVAPPPSAANLGNVGSGRAGTIGGYAGQVVPPPPSVLASGGSRAGRPDGVAVAVVPPPPTLAGLGSSATGRSGSMPGAGMRGQAVVPPPPSVPFAGHFAGTGAVGGASGGVVPPPPAANGVAGAGLQRAAYLASANVPVLRPPAVQQQPRSITETEGARKSPLGGRLPGELFPEDGQQSSIAGEELDVAFLGLAVPLPGSTYFASEEIFLAEERLTPHHSRLIKLVYEFLPYQPRLSEFGPNYPAVDKLRATRDPSCDEALVQGTIASPPHIRTKYMNQRQSTLACYRTTADDYRKARERAHH